jgi:hypothetical protein
LLRYQLVRGPCHSILLADGLKSRDYSRDLRPAKWGSEIKLQGSNLGTSDRRLAMSALCQKQTLCGATNSRPFDHLVTGS